MDAIKFIEERNRLCSMYSGCTKCPVFRGNDSCLFSATNGGTPDEQVKILSVWVADHPCKTHQSVFLEHYPNARLDSEGVICICPEAVYGDEVKALCVKSKMCHDCRHTFWPQEVKE